jgi:hypothetical protein
MVVLSDAVAGPPVVGARADPVVAGPPRSIAPFADDRSPAVPVTRL